MSHEIDFKCHNISKYWNGHWAFTDDEWESLCQVIGKPELLTDSRFATFDARKDNEDKLDKIISGWSANHTAEQVETMMQDAGIAASVVENMADVFNDPQIKHREFFQLLKHSVIGEHNYRGLGFQLSKTPDTRFAGPALGEHNEYVFKELLGMSDDEISDALVDGAITTEADLPEFTTSL